MNATKYLWCLFGMFLGGMIAIYLGKELNWDLANYHYYNAFYFLNSRWQQDSWPATFIHVNFTPTLDFLTYFLIQFFTPKTAVFMLGAIHGLNFILIASITYLFTKNKFLVLAISLLALYGPTAMPGIGSFQHDNLVSLFVLSFIYLQLRWCMNKANNYRYYFLSAIVLGLGVGAKLTTGLFVGGALLTTSCMPGNLKQISTRIFLLSVGVGIGLLLTSGYWMLHLWQTHHNPFFPLWNGFFHSTDFPFYNWHDTRFLPKNGWQTLFYPFYFSLDGRTNDTPFRDFRFAVTYFLLLGVVVKTIKLKKINFSLNVRWLFLFFISSYLLWQSYFSIMRYIVVLEMLTPLMIYLLLRELINDKIILLSITFSIFFLLAITLIFPTMIRAPWYRSDYFNVKLPSDIKHIPVATMLMPYPEFALQTHPRPQTYLIPFFPKGWHFLGIPFRGKEYTLPRNIVTLAKKQKVLYFLTPPSYQPILYEITQALGFTRQGPCEEITSDRQRAANEPLFICTVKK